MRYNRKWLDVADNTKVKVMVTSTGRRDCRGRKVSTPAAGMISGSLQGDVVVTTKKAAAAWRAQSIAAATCLAGLFAVSVAGCSTTPDILSGAGTVAETTAPAATQTSGTKVAIAPVIGAPDQVAKQLQAQLATAIQKRNIGIETGPGALYTLRGYVVSAREGNGTKISYIWDVTDKTGKRVNRISGEEITAGASQDPWASVTPAVMTNITEKTANSLATWLPTQAAAAPAVAGAVQTAPAQAGQAVRNAANAANQQVQQAAARATAPANGTTTGSINSVQAIVPNVVGAPGDGSQSLTRAIRNELSRNGVGLASATGNRTYRVEGRVGLKNASAGQQQITIDWDVKDPAGKKLGTVSQKNAIPAGSLNGAWGKTADAAAAAAAQGILKLLPQKQARAN